MGKVRIIRKTPSVCKKSRRILQRSTYKYQLSGDKLKVIAVSSVRPGEGKSTTSTNIAWAFARAGYKTLLIDADIRNSVMSGVFMSTEKNHWFDRLLVRYKRFITWFV